MVAEIETIDAGFTGHLGDVRALGEVISRGSISAAARSLGETKGAISRRISRLEARLGVHLLARSQRRVTPTDEGLRFHQRAAAALIELDEAADEARGQAMVPRGRLRLSAPIDLACDVLPALLVEFRQAWPQISIDLRVDNARVDLAAERIDLALRVSGSPPQPPNFGHALTVMNLALFASRQWLHSHAAPATPDQLGPESMVICDLPGAAAIPLVSPAGQVAPLARQGALVASDFAAAKALVLAGAGIALLPQLIVRDAVRRGELVPVLPQWLARGANLYAVTLAGRDEPARSRVFRQFLAARLAE